MPLELPVPVEEFDLVMDDGAPIRFRRHGEVDSELRLFVSHGNGFATDAYLPFWGPLCERYDVVVFDTRNHGHNQPSDPASHHYAQMARDIGRIHAGVSERLGARRSAGVFHSMSARAAMKHAVEIGWVWDALVLFDPPDVPLEDHPLYPEMAAFEVRLVDWASNRPNRFADPSELAAEYARTRAHRGWVDGAHELMARSVLHLEAETGEWVLTCPRELEAAIYQAALTLNLWPKGTDFGGPVKLIGADPGIEAGPPTGKANQTLARENGYDYDFIPGTGHMLQIEKPAECIRALETFLVDCSLV